MHPNDLLYADRIIIEPYNPLWPQKAALEIAVLKRALAYPWVAEIQHVGSTAVPGLAAKPIIDIYVGVTSINEAQAAIQPIQNLGYQYWDENPNKEKMFFVKGMPPHGEGRTHHIHIVAHGSRYWRAVTLFRDYLCAHP